LTLDLSNASRMRHGNAFDHVIHRIRHLAGMHHLPR